MSNMSKDTLIMVGAAIRDHTDHVITEVVITPDGVAQGWVVTNDGKTKLKVKDYGTVSPGQKGYMCLTLRSYNSVPCVVATGR